MHVKTLPMWEQSLMMREWVTITSVKASPGGKGWSYRDGAC